MNNFLKYFLLSLAITITSCKQNHEKDLLDTKNESPEIIHIEYTIPIILSEEFKDTNKISGWSNYNLVEYNILVLANSINSFINDDDHDIENQLNIIEKYLINLRRSVYPEVFYTPELISRFKLLNVQVTNTKIILNEFDKLTLVKEFDKIFQYFNNCNNIMKYIVDNKSIIID
tara:strand:- start:4483 stop:5004 length:522 start_codon:yes stop_codon:yes gene_type:complete